MILIQLLKSLKRTILYLISNKLIIKKNLFMFKIIMLNRIIQKSVFWIIILNLKEYLLTIDKMNIIIDIKIQVKNNLFIK